MSEEVFPFVSVCWNGRKIKQEWESTVQRISQANFIAEYEMIKRGHRRANTYHIAAWKFDDDINWATENGLVVLGIHRTQAHEGYDHRFYMHDTIKQDTLVYGVAALTYEDAKAFKDAHTTNGTDHKLVGQMLGYPQCCIDWFLSVWPHKTSEPMFLLAQNTEGAVQVDNNTVEVTGNPLLNILPRAFGLRTCSFYPHSMLCDDAAKFCGHWVDIMMEYEPDATENLIEALNMPMEWSMHHGIVEVRTPLFRGATNGVFTDSKQVIRWLGE